MRIDVISIFPELFEGPLSSSMLGIARERGAMEFHAHDLREWTRGVHRQVDDYSYGGGPGMVMKPEPFFEAVDAVRDLDQRPPTVVMMTPQGERFTQSVAEEFAALPRIVFLCGRYEGFDERIRTLADRQVSIGDFVLTGGELPAMVVVDAISRLLPGVLGHENSTTEESFSWGLLEYPQYTRPATYAGLEVPSILLSGDHAKIAAWRRREAIRRTALLRPDLLDSADLTDEERAWAQEALECEEAYDEGGSTHS